MNGTNTLVLAVLAFAGTLTAQISTITCQPGYATAVVAFSTGANQNGSSPSNALGNNTSSNFNLGDRGWITVAFDRAFTTSGNSLPDLFVDEGGTVDCYWVCLRPRNAATTNALIAAGIPMMGDLFQLPQQFCGDATIDLDAFVPGYTTCQLEFSELMIEDDGNGGNGAEIVRLRAEFVCDCPAPNEVCLPGYPKILVGYRLGSNHSGTDPRNVLGNDPGTYHNLGNGGDVVVAFDGEFTTDGGAGQDVVVDEFGVSDCYYLDVRPADGYTLAAIQAAGLTNVWSDYYRLPPLLCSDAGLDIDQVLPGHPAGRLRFLELVVEDDANGGNGAEIANLLAQAVCTVVECAEGYGYSVLASVAGQNAQGTDPRDALGNTPGTYHSLGNDGCLEIAFEGVFTTTRSAATDLFVDEYGVTDCWFLGLAPADSATRAAVETAGLVRIDGYYWIPTTFCSDSSIDLDAFVPTPSGSELHFAAIKVRDDGDGGNGAEIALVRAAAVCTFYARLGDRVWIDANRDGDQDAGELDVAGAVVKLRNPTTNAILQQATTGADGLYGFTVMPGSYVVEVCYDTITFDATTKNTGGNPQADSDLDPQTGRTDAIAVGMNEVRLDIDAGLVVDCTTLATAFSVNSLPACGLALDPVLTAPAPLLGATWNFDIASQFPHALAIVFCMIGPPQPTPIPGTNCTVWVDLFNLVVLAEGTTDASGHYRLPVDLPLPALPALAGLDFTLQARVCYPAIPGPLPGFPDWISNALWVRIGCP